MAALSEEVKRRIVVELASFRTTADVSTILLKEYDLEVRSNDLGRYDATREYFVGGAALAELFHAARRKFVENVSDIPIAHQGYRLRKLQQLFEEAERWNRWKIAAAILAQVAQELGGRDTAARKRVENEEQETVAVEQARQLTACSRGGKQRPEEQARSSRPAPPSDPRAPAPDGAKDRLDEEESLEPAGGKADAGKGRAADALPTRGLRGRKAAANVQGEKVTATRDDGEAWPRFREAFPGSFVPVCAARPAPLDACDKPDCDRPWDREMERKLYGSPEAASDGPASDARRPGG